MIDTRNRGDTLDDAQIWLGLHGQRFGPYDAATVLHWHQQGQLDNDTLCWREGMAEWLPLATWLRERSADAAFGEPPPLESPPPGLTPRTTSVMRDLPAAPAHDLPPAPSLHWGWVFLLSVVTIGIFLIVWVFVQAVWIKRVDPKSPAVILLVVAVICGFLGGASGIDSPTYFGGQLVQVVLTYVAYYSMANSLRRFGSERGLPMPIGGVTLFFFTTFYLQAQLTRIAHWQRTGIDEPADKRIFWVTYGTVMALLVLLVIGLSLR
jgi:hypothetical protein